MRSIRPRVAGMVGTPPQTVPAARIAEQAVPMRRSRARASTTSDEFMILALDAAAMHADALPVPE